MFKNISAALGFGGAKVDTILDRNEVLQGGLVSGYVKVIGGKVDQSIEAIIIKLMTKVKQETGDNIEFMDHVLAQYSISEAFNAAAGVEYRFDFEFDLHPEAPITTLAVSNNQCVVWLDTELDIDYAIDASDKDVIHVLPLPAIANIMSKLIEDKDLKLVKSDMESGTISMPGFTNESGAYQEIEFRKSSIFSRGELELSFAIKGDTLYGLAEIDRALRGDTYKRFDISINASEAEIDDLVDYLI
ncbi:MAG: sporulation protein [Moritella sp.]|uniref:sporulation protein n=1 Tax=Moritella sp. TaxID=78556 RepID=UPI0029A1BB53|nr:sporulation protein [Moritella sp.]MDX2319548.1 sporulation protein [Moritella sp.]